MFAPLQKIGVPFPRRVGLAIEVIERTALALPIHLEGCGVGVDGYRIRRVRLKFDRIRTRVGRGVDNFERAFDVAVVIAREFGDDEDRIAPSDDAPAYVYRSMFHCLFWISSARRCVRDA